MTTLLVKTHASPPWVDVGIWELPANVGSVVVTREIDTISESVREPVLMAGLTGRVVDYDAPVGRSLRYRVAVYSTTGGLISAVYSSPVTLSAPATGYAWISDPLAPKDVLLLPLTIGTDTERTFTAPMRAVRRTGARLPVVSSGVRGAAESVPLGWGTETAAEAQSVEALIGAGSLLLVRTGPDTLPHATGVLYVGAEQIRKSSLWPSEAADWSATTFVAAGPAIASVVFPRTLDDVTTEAATINDLKAIWTGKTLLSFARG